MYCPVCNKNFKKNNPKHFTTKIHYKNQQKSDTQKEWEHKKNLLACKKMLYDIINGVNKVEYKKEKIFSLGKLQEGNVIARPSLIIKTSYIADVNVNDENVLCHNMSSSCCGYVSKGSNVLMTKKNSKTARSKYSIDIVFDKNTLVGSNPLYSNKMIDICLQNNYIKDFPTFDYVKSEYTIDESRFDFFCMKNDIKYFIEVKSVPHADYVDVDKKYRKHYNETYDYNSKIATFPEY
jgi:hypothetical protein